MSWNFKKMNFESPYKTKEEKVSTAKIEWASQHSKDLYLKFEQAKPKLAERIIDAHLSVLEAHLRIQASGLIPTPPNVASAVGIDQGGRLNQDELKASYNRMVAMGLVEETHAMSKNGRNYSKYSFKGLEVLINGLLGIQEKVRKAR